MIVLYTNIMSPPCRSVTLCIDHLNLNVEFKEINLLEKEQLSPEFLKINPMHTIPALIDDDLTIWESGAIMKYLVTKYAPGNEIYPNDIKQRAKIDCILMSFVEFFTVVKNFFVDILMLDLPGDEKKLNAVLNYLKCYEKLLASRKWFALQHLTVADFSFAGIIETLVACGLSLKNFPNIDRWLRQCRSTINKYNETNLKGLTMLAEKFRNKTADDLWKKVSDP